MITLKESLLSKTKDKVGDANKNIEDILNVPSINDFYVSKWNRNHIQIDWNCQELLDTYRSKYPEVLYREGSGLLFQIDQTWRQAQILNVYVFKPNKNNWFLRGWTHAFTGSNLRIYKKEVIKLIEDLAHNPDKMDAFLKHAEEQFRKQQNVEKDPFTDL
jgi:predicted Rdx family selenoprotein